MDYDGVVQFVQEQFTDGLVLVVGSGLSAAEGVPGMPELAAHLTRSSQGLIGQDMEDWGKVADLLASGTGLEAALLKVPTSESLQLWITRKTCDLLVPVETGVIRAVVKRERTLRLTTFLGRVLKPPGGLPILTPNYDRLIEVACEMAGFHVDTTAIGTYAAAFDHERSCMGACRGINNRGKVVTLDHFPRAVVLKPHGSLDWYHTDAGPIRCSVELGADRLIITPGLNKYRAGYNAPFDKHRDLANDHIKRAARLLAVGYGFNDDHLQTHLLRRIKDGTPTLILNRTAAKHVEDVATTSPRCVIISAAPEIGGINVVSKDTRFQRAGASLWDLAVLTKELLA